MPALKPKFGAKSEFVRSIDRAVPAQEVVALARQQGIELTTGFVYNIRSSSSGRMKVSPAANGSQPLNGNHGSNGNHPPSALTRAATTPEAQLRTAIARIGLLRARQILDEVEATFAGEERR